MSQTERRPELREARVAVNEHKVKVTVQRVYGLLGSTRLLVILQDIAD